MEGHEEAVLVVSFSPDGALLASASGDATVRLWDNFTSTPSHTLRGHTQWVLTLGWHALGGFLASAGMDGKVIVWDPETGLEKMKGIHGKYVLLLLY